MNHLISNIVKFVTPAGNQSTKLVNGCYTVNLVGQGLSERNVKEFWELINELSNTLQSTLQTKALKAVIKHSNPNNPRSLTIPKEMMLPMSRFFDARCTGRSSEALTLQPAYRAFDKLTKILSDEATPGWEERIREGDLKIYNNLKKDPWLR